MQTLLFVHGLFGLRNYRDQEASEGDLKRVVLSH